MVLDPRARSCMLTLNGKRARPFSAIAANGKTLQVLKKIFSLDQNQHFFTIVLDPRARSCLLTLNGKRARPFSAVTARIKTKTSLS